MPVCWAVFGGRSQDDARHAPGPMRGKGRGVTKSPKRGRRRNRRKP